VAKILGERAKLPGENPREWGERRTEVTEGDWWLKIFGERMSFGRREHGGSRVKQSILKEAPPYENAGSSGIFYFSEGTSEPKIFSSH
jgi:hypothetical protein